MQSISTCLRGYRVSFLSLAFVGTVVGFDSTGSAAVLFSDNFNSDTLPNYAVKPSLQATWNSTAGVGGGAGIVIGQSVNDSMSFVPGNPTNTPFKIGAGATNAVTISMMLKLNAAGFGGGNSKAFLGLASGLNAEWGQNPPAGSSIIGGAAQGAVQIGTRSGINGGAASNGNMQGGVALTGGNWYLYSVTLEKPTTGTTWIASSFLQDFGATGTAAGGVVSSFSGLNVPMTGDTTLSAAGTDTYLNFGVRNQSFSAVDNFNVTGTLIPEPTSAALVLASGGAAIARRRRHAVA